ncbi:uncharacterized protein LOC135218387 [Macrobrachium nipponense]|uniref:uncharacterized protein LOC135218387 n=1 Tax=Macrobrachium nipponense TaxID=159736 RepID=UPI0030C821FD
MMSWKCQVVLLRWWGLLGLSFVAHALKKHYVIDYGDAMGRATVEVDEKAHLASISPFNSTNPATLMNFRKSITIYVTNTECLVSKLQTKEGDYKQQLAHKLNPSQNRAALYVMGSISPHRVRQLLGEEHYRFCFGKPTLRLSHRRPRLPTHIFSIHPDDASKTPDQDSGDVGTEHQRYKRGAKKNKKDKSSKAQRGKDKKPKKDKKNKKKPKTKSLSTTQQLNIKAPRISFPSAYIPHNLTDTTTVLQGSSDHVVLQEEPYLSPSFIRNGDDGSGFRHYRDFHQESNPGNETRSLGPIRHIISHDISVQGDGDTKILIPETIVKDGQIFYRYDADEGAVDATKGQSKRSHTREGDTMDEGAQFDAPFEYHNDSEDSPTGFLPSHERRISQDEAHFKTDYSMINTPGFSQVHTQAQMGDGIRDASAAVLSDDGSGVHVLGNTDSEGFFVAQAHSIGHPGGRRTSLAHIFGNTHGVLGSAMTNGHGHQSHVQVDMGAHPSSTAHIATHDGSTLLTSSIRATQLGGRAGAQAYGDGASASDAQMEFNPSHPLLGGTGGLTGQGLASATVTKSGSSLLTSISGEAAGGSYLGTAKSSLSHDPGFSSTGENATWEIHEDYGPPDGITHEFGHPNDITHDFGHPDELAGSSHYQDFIHGRHFTDRVPYHTEDMREISSSSHSEGSIDQGHSDHASGGHMIDNIMETVHQPDRQAEIIAYPVSEQSIIDEGGLVGGAGIPPRESEIGQTPLRDRESLTEGRGIATGGSKAGIVGLATYSQGQVGAPPGPGELLNYPVTGSDKYDYNYYEGGYGSEYYTEEYDGEIPQDPRNLPYFDLGAHINGFQPIESNFENFEPMQLGLPGHPVVDPSSLSVDHIDLPVLVSHKYEEPDIQEITPDPPITVHQVQAPTLLPDDTQSSDAIVSHGSQESHEEEYSGDNDFYDHVSLPFPDSPTIAPYISTSQPHILISPHISTTSPTPHTTLPETESTSQHQSYLGEVISEHTGPHHDLPQETHLPFRLPGVISGQQTISSSSFSENDTLIPGIPQEVSRIHSSQFDTQSHTGPQSLPQETIQQHSSQFDTQRRTGPQRLPQETILQHSSQFDTQRRTGPQSLPQETIQQHSSQFDTQRHTRPQSLPQQTIQQQGTGGGMMMMMGIPLDPGNPGSIHYLPGNDGGPDLKVMSVAARQEHSLLSQRQRMFLQPGQKIPGAPGYKVPPGFRGHVILDENLPGTSESRGVAQGFSTHVRASPQSSFSGPIYTSVSGPDASQHISEEGVHVTLSGDDGPSPWRTGSDRSRTSQQVGQTHSAVRSQPISGSAPTSRQPAGGATPRKSWDGRRGGGPTSQKSWGTPSNIQRVGSDGECGYYSMNCQPAFGPNERDQICRPILITIGCCC